MCQKVAKILDNQQTDRAHRGYSRGVSTNDVEKFKEHITYYTIYKKVSSIGRQHFSPEITTIFK